MNKKIELLAPAGNYESFIAAINYGANAVYLAGKNFNARTFASNFTIEEIEQMLKYAHSLDVKVYVTVNTLIKDSEIMDALKFVEALYKANVDAILMQDVGLINIVHKAYPDLVLHASTQMNCTTVNDAKRLKEMGFSRIVLARECSLETIKEIKEKVDIELEVFCHGALCMSYSGNCLMSSLIGGRSGNRGKCAQSCRQEYILEYTQNGEMKELDKKYYLSTKDLLTLDHMEELKNANIDSLKIEGRGKEASYVGTVVKWYRKALDGALSKQDTSQGIKELKLSYNRLFTKGHLFEEPNQDFTNVDTVNHLGLEIGHVLRVNKQTIVIELTEDLNMDDAIRIVNKDGVTKDAIIINNMYQVDEMNKSIGLVKNAKKGMLIRLQAHNEELKNGYTVLKTKDNRLIEEVKNKEAKKIKIDGVVSLKDKHLVLELKKDKLKVVLKTPNEVELAKNPNQKDRIIDSISKTGDTSYTFASLTYQGEAAFVPSKEVNELRRNALEALERKQIESYQKDYHFNKFKTTAKEYKNELRMYAKVSSIAQANACIDSGIHFIISENKKLIDDLTSKNSEESIHFIYMAPRLSVENPMIGFDTKNNDKLLSVYANVFNIFALNYYHEQGFSIIGISPELSKKEIVELVNRYQNTFKKTPNLMMMVYGRSEMMIMKHCPINKALGYQAKGCHACERNQYYLKDKKDYEFPLVKTIDCNLKVLNSRTTSLIDYLKEIMKIGVNNLLLDFTLESYEETLKVLENYIPCFENQENGIEPNPYTTHGAYEEGIE